MYNRFSDLLAKRFGVSLTAAAIVMISAMISSALVFAGANDSPPEQSIGHIRPQDIHNGVTAIEITVRGRKIPCIVAAGYYSDVALSISCNWNKNAN